MPRLTRKIWIGIGAAAIVGATPVGHASAQHTQHHDASTKPPAKDSGAASAIGSGEQGGEAYLTEGRPRDTRVFYYRSIALMRGHLLIGDELIPEGKWDEALPHFLHPTEELYGLIAPYMKGQGIPPFATQLKALAQTVKAKRKPAYEQARSVVHARIDRALEAAHRFMKPLQLFTLITIVEVLKSAKSEYQEAIDDGKFAKAVEYEDSRGFVWYAEQMFEKVAPQVAAKDPQAIEQIRKTVAELKTAWPQPTPPPLPLKTVDELGAKISQIEELTAKLQ